MSAQSETPELLPCPFCGGEPYYDNDDNGSAWIQCGDCGARSPSRRITTGDGPLFDAWNRRQLSAQGEGARLADRELAEYLEKTIRDGNVGARYSLALTRAEILQLMASLRAPAAGDVIRPIRIDLYELLTNIQNGISSPADADMANSLLRRIDKLYPYAAPSAPAARGWAIKGPDGGLLFAWSSDVAGSVKPQQINEGNTCAPVLIVEDKR